MPLRTALPAFALASFTALSFALVGCSIETSTSDPAPPTGTSDSPPSQTPQKATVPAEDPPTVAEPTPTIDDSVFAEVVYVFMRDTDHRLWFCTGTLVSDTTVVTAAHCLDTTMFVSYEIVAPLAPGRPRISASDPRSFGGHFDDVANPDIGILTLNKPLALPRYATLTDVVTSVENGDPIDSQAIVRTDEKPTAPFTSSEIQPVSSTVQYGYEHGFGTPLFTKGGDSGAGLFLVENGKMTHKLIATARQPEPDRGIDHFTRVDPAFLQWFAEQTN